MSPCCHAVRSVPTLGLNPIQLLFVQAQYPAILMLAIGLELAGAVLFICGSNLGSLLLLAFMLPVTAVRVASAVTPSTHCMLQLPRLLPVAAVRCA